MSTSYTLNRDQIITYALRKCGVLELGVVPDSNTIEVAQESLNIMVKSWIIRGIKLWTQTELVLPLKSGQTSYTIGPVGPDLITDKPQRLFQAWIRNVADVPPIDIPLMLLSNRDYNVLGSKFSTGTPNSIYMNVERDASVVSLFTTPDLYSQGSYQVHLISQRLLQDANLSTGTLDFPQEWLLAIGWNLAAELAVDFGLDFGKIQWLEQKAAKFLTEVEDWDVEYTSTMFTPDVRTYRV